MNEFSLQGELDVAGTKLIEAAAKTIVRVNNLRFNNPSASKLTLSIYKAKNYKSVNVYNLTLDPGDTVTDSYTYFLEPGDYIVATPDITGTIYLVYGIVTSIP